MTVSHLFESVPAPTPENEGENQDDASDNDPLAAAVAADSWGNPIDPVAPQWRNNHASTMLEIKSRVHRRVLERLNLSNLEAIGREEAAHAIRRVVQDLLVAEHAALNTDEREQVVQQILDEIFGLGPLEPLMKDDEISDILVNTAGQVFTERHGKLQQTDIRFKDNRHLLEVIDRIVSSMRRPTADTMRSIT
jgi:pilus assembly protein CpaF